jgi:hypothetical protein
MIDALLWVVNVWKKSGYEEYFDGNSDMVCVYNLGIMVLIYG